MPALATLKPSLHLTSQWFLATRLNTILILFEHRLTTFAGLVRDALVSKSNLQSPYSPPTAEFALTLLCFLTPDIESNINHIEYDMDDDDEAWLARVEREHRLSINSDDFEYLIDFLEKQEYLYPMIKLNLDKAIKEVRPDLQPALRLVHDYWRQRIAERGGRPLLRRFLNHGAEKQPFAAFGVKMIPPPTQQKKRAPIEDERAYARLCYVQAQFVQARLLLARILQREELKREKVRLTSTVLELLVHHKHGGGHGNSAGSGLLATAPFASPSNGSFVHPNSLSHHALAQSIPAAAAYAAQLAEAQAAPPVSTYPAFPTPGAAAASMGPNGPVAALPHQAVAQASHPHHNNTHPHHNTVQASTSSASSHMQPQAQHNNAHGLQHPLPGKRPHPGAAAAAAAASASSNAMVNASSSTSPHSMNAAGSSAMAGGAAAMASTSPVSSSAVVQGAKATGTPRGRIVLKASAATVAARAAQAAQSPTSSALPSPHHLNGGAAMATHPNGAMMMVPPGGPVPPSMALNQPGYLASPRTVVSPHHNHLAVSGGQHPHMGVQQAHMGGMGGPQQQFANNAAAVSSPRVHSPYPPTTAAGYASPRSPLPPGYQPPTKITAAVASPRNVLAVSGSAPALSGSPRPGSVQVMGAMHPAAAATYMPPVQSAPVHEEAHDEDRGVKLEGEFALNPDNLLRGYPFIGGMKRPSDANKGSNGKRKAAISSASPPARQPHIGLTNAAMAAANAAANAKRSAPSRPSPFSSKQFSPFFDPLTGTRYDEYTVHDDEVMTMEELELECEEEEEDALISNLEQTIAGSALPASYQAFLEPNRGDTDALIYKQGFAAQDVEYNPTDTLLQWNKSDLSYLRKEWLESTENPYNLPSFASALPAPATTSKSADPSSLPSNSVAQRQPPSTSTVAPSSLTLPQASTKQFRLPVVEPLMLPATLPGYHVYSVRPAMSGPLPPRRYQVKTTITPNTVNGLPYATWLNGAQMPVGLLSTVPEKAFHHPLPKHDDFAPPTETSNQYRGFDDAVYEMPHAKRFKLANGEMGYDVVDADELADALPETMFLTAENASYNLIDLERDGLRAVRARKRVDRFGRVVWDTIPTSYFDEVEKDEKAREEVRNRILAERAAVLAASRALEPPIESVELQQASNGSSSSSSASSSSPTYDGSYPSNPHSSASSTTTTGRAISVGTAVSSQSASDFDLSSIMSNSMNSTVSSEPNSLDAVSGETTIANGSCSHSPYETSPNSGHSPMSGKIPIHHENIPNPIYPMSAQHPPQAMHNGTKALQPSYAPPPMSSPMPHPQQRPMHHQQRQAQAVDASPYNPLVVHLHQRHHMPATALPQGQDLIIHDPHADVLNSSHMMMDVPLTENLEDMPWL